MHILRSNNYFIIFLKVEMIIDFMYYDKDFFNKIRRNIKTLIFRYLINVKDQIVDEIFFRNYRIRRR